VTLLLASQSNDVQRLWYTENNVMVPSLRYAAVGAGGMFARILLGQLWTPHMELRRTALLAAYVVYLVKQSIPGCGQDTTLAILSKTGGVHVGTKEVRVMEAAFEKYRDVESTVLHYAITGGDKVSLGGLSAALKKARRDIRASFTKAIQ
jgi:20S proteasome alpha/beta subunit